MNPLPPLPFSNTYWVLPGKLMAGPYPGHWRIEEAEPRLRALFECGIRHIINLMEADEVDHQGRAFVPYLETLRSFAKQAGEPMGWNRYPIRDGGITSQENMRRILNEIDAAQAAGRPVYVHCWGGKGRTGTVIGCYLARHGLASGKQALEQITMLRQAISPWQPSPETEQQEEMVRFWKIGE